MRYFKIFYILFWIIIANNAFAFDLHNWQIGFQKAASPVMQELEHFHDILLYVISAIVILVFGLLGYICIRFNAKRNPIPSTNSHNTLIEIIWTVIPILVLIAISIPSFRILHFMEQDKEADMTIKVVAHQWYWNYEYPDHGNITFDSYLIKDEDLKPGQLRLLSVDNNLVVPVGTRIKVLITSADVIHSWAVPSLGIKMDAIPGRTNETWFQVLEPGIYYGQCSEICGAGHGFMPIAVEAVDADSFQLWLKQAQKQFTN
jgi:cytochrome c oxidase subunit 2